jgi:ligand-binding sensor domain-containing protein/signal transduction histidine kinase
MRYSHAVLVQCSTSTLRRAVVILVVQISAFAAAGATAQGNAIASEYSLRLWRIEDGLPQNRIRALCQTPDGYLWIGTDEGLARFDGIRFTIFDQSNTAALHDNGILTLKVGADGSLWIGTRGGGLARYKDGLFRGFGVSEGLTNGFVRTIYEDRRQTLWVGTDRGFFRREGERFVRLDNTPEVPLASVVSIGEDDAGRIWATSNAGLLSAGDKLLRVPSDCGAGPTNILQQSSHGFLWVIGTMGAARLKNGCMALEPPLPAIRMTSLIEDRDGTLWIGTMGKGLMRARSDGVTSITALSGLPDNAVNVVFEDRELNLWIGCQDGLVRLTKRSGRNIGAQDGLEDDNVSTVYADPHDNLWFTTLTGQVYRVANGVVQRYRLPAPTADLRVTTVFQERKGAMWFGTSGSGLVSVEGNGATVFTKANGLRSNTVRQILEDRSGILWIGLDSGLSRWDGHSFQNYYLPEGLSYPSVRSMIVEAQGDLLVGTDAGLNRVHENRIVADPEFAALAKDRIWSIYQDSSGTLWLGTRGNGLIRYRRGKIVRFTKEKGLLTDTIQQILEDGHGKLWMSTSSGVISADRKELDAAAEGGTLPIHVIPYGTADGMATSQMNGGWQPAGARTSDGELWFPTVKGAVRINPAQIPPHHTAPILIERVMADDRAVSLAGNVVIPPGHGRLAIDYTLCDLVNPQRVSFRYKLEEFDENWTPALQGRSAYYTNLPPGHYRFHVIASDAASASVSEAFVALTLQPSFYQTTWFYALLALAAGTVVWGGFALYARQTRERYALLLTERTRLAREMHDTVIQGCVGVSTLLEAAARFRNVDTVEAETLLEQARIEANTTLEEARQAVWDLRHPEAAESPIDMLFDLARKLGKEHGIRIETEMAGKGSLDPETDRTILLVGREALRNAVVHGKPGNVSLRISFEPAEVSLMVTDNGSGFAADHEQAAENRHFGILGMRERVEKLGGAFSIVSEPGAGTRVVARIPRAGVQPSDATTPQFRAGAR